MSMSCGTLTVTDGEGGEGEPSREIPPWLKVIGAAAGGGAIGWAVV